MFEDKRSAFEETYCDAVETVKTYISRMLTYPSCALKRHDERLQAEEEQYTGIDADREKYLNGGSTMPMGGFASAMKAREEEKKQNELLREIAEDCEIDEEEWDRLG